MLDYHWIPVHRAGEDRDYFVQQRPRFIKVISDDEKPPQVEDVLEAGASLIVRNYPMSENYMNRNLGSLADAERIGHEHAAACERMNRFILERGMPQERIFYEGLNEPHLWVPQERPELVAVYERARCRGVHDFGGRSVLGNLGVGWPGNSDNGGGQRGISGAPPMWAWFAPVAEVMITTGVYMDYLGLHEYWAWDGPQPMWRWWAGRSLWCPYQVPILITECGIDGGVVGQWSKGWNSLPQISRDDKARQYIDELWWYMNELRKDPRQQGVFVFTYDESIREEWAEFNIRDSCWKAAVVAKRAAEGMPAPQAFGPTPVPIPVPVPVPPVPIPVPVPELRINRLVGRLPEHPWKRHEIRDVATISKLIVHHTGAAVPDIPTSEHIAAIAAWQIRTYGWPGIAYHYMIDQAGVIYQTQPHAAISYHTYGHNAEGLGICLIGNFSTGQPTPEQLGAAAALVAWLRVKFGRPVPLFGHRDLGATVCPGNTWSTWRKALETAPVPVPAPVPIPVPVPDPLPYHVTSIWTAIGGLYLILGNYPVPGTELHLTAWGNTWTAIAGHKPELGIGGFEFSLPAVGSYVLNVGAHDWPALDMVGRGVLTLMFS